MGESRPILARERDAESPAGPAGLFAGLRRPKLLRLALRSYRRERIAEICFPIASALMEGGFIGVIAVKIFHVHPGVLALISAAPMFGNLSSFLWARLSQGRRKVPFIVGLQSLFIALAFVIALVPLSSAGAWLVVGSLIASRLVLGGIITIRSLVWTLNYPREARGRVTWRLSVLATLTIVVTSVIGGFVLDADPGSFRLVYSAGALLAVAGVVAFSGVRLVDEEEQLALERGTSVEADSKPENGETLSAWGVLREDPLYARYQSWQFLLGVSNMLIEAPLIYLVTVQLHASFTVSIGLTQVIPMLLSIVTIPLWAAYIDRVHISEFRSRHSWLFAASQALLWVGALYGSFPLIALARVILGVARGGGILAWQLGHNDFADPQRVGLYMGVHVTLTGIRGAFAPFLGMLLYVGWASFDAPLLDLRIPEFDGVGPRLMLAASGLSTIAALGFVSLHRRMASRR
jgi:MFS family permease